MPKKARSTLSLHSRWVILSRAAILATAPLAASSPANAVSFTQIDVPGAIDNGTGAFGINDLGQIVGSFFNSTGQHGFLDTGGSFTQLDVPGNNSYNFAYGINDAGQIVGGFVANGMGEHGFLDTGGSFTQIDVPGATNFNTQAFGINDLGQIVGSFFNSTGQHGFLDTGGSFTQLDVPGASSTMASGINDAGQIVGGTGQHGFLDTGGSFTQLDVPGALFTSASGINGARQIVGYFSTHGFLTTGSATGDPHFITYDGVHYDYQGVGDFVLAQSTVPGDQFDVQVRTTPWYDGAPVTIMSEAAATLCNHNVTFDIDRAAAGGSFVWLDGTPLSLSIDNPVLTLDACKIVELSNISYQVVWNTGEILDVTNNGTYLDLSSSLSWIDGLGSMEGLLSSDLNPEAWQVTDATSLFDDAGDTAIPEPGTLTLLGIGLVGLGVMRLRGVTGTVY